MSSKITSKFALTFLGGLFVVLFFSPLKWIFHSLYAPEYRLHSILLIGFVVFLLLKKRGQEVFNNLKIQAAPLVVFLVGLAGFITTQKFLDIDVISCFFFGLSIYGFFGFLVDFKKWKDSSAFVLLFFACLPLSYHIETFLGFPLRLISAKIAEAFFSLTSHQVHSTETILLVENKLAHIDLPCSGIKSLWSISLFSLILSIVEKYKVNAAWIMAFVCGWILVASANIFRIIMLVFIYSSDLPETMKVSLHVPIGLVGFMVACLATYWIFRQFGQKVDSVSELNTNRFSYKAFGTIATILIIAISIHQLRPANAAQKNLLKHYQEAKDSLPLTDKEKDLFLRHGVIAYQKKKFDIDGIRGTAFLVLSKSWRGHHHPEQCLQGQGLPIESTKTLVIEDKLQVRNVTIKNSEHEVAYWFQAIDDSTDDYSSRVWSGFISPDRPYTMVSLYLENGNTADPSAFKNLIKNFHRQAVTMLEHGGKDEKQN